MCSIPGLGRSPGGGNGNPLQYSCLENPMDGGAWRATVHGVAKSRTRLSDFTYLLTKFSSLNQTLGWGGRGGDEGRYYLNSSIRRPVSRTTKSHL